MAEIDRYFTVMVDSGASDLHLSSNCPPMLRVHGSMTTIPMEGVLDAAVLRPLLFEIAPEKNRKQFDESGDTDFAYSLEPHGRFRCNFFLDRHGIGAVFRLIPSKILTVDDLNLSQAIRNLCYLPKGLVLVTGPTGSGKSTTLCALIDMINRTRQDHVITIEDPIEFVHQNKQCLINQREVGIHTGSFKNALRAALREDPDIVLVGEMRDLETTEIAIETAETGHLVFGTLHTSTAYSTVDRLIDQFPADRQDQIRTMLASSLKGVVAQNLLKRKDGSGRIAALEVLIANHSIASNIREGKTYQIPSAMQTGGKYGMILLNDALHDLVAKGIVSPEEAYRKALNKEEILNKFQQAGIRFNPDSLTNEIPAAPAQAGTAAPAMPASPPPAAAPRATPAAPPPQQPQSGGFTDPFEEFKRKQT
ncbi:type IV pilus twitching motility protein PilT [Planctomycetota bacterium]